MTRQNNQIQDKKIILVLDTSWLMEIGARKENLLMELLRPPHIEIKIHNRVLKELDGLKNVEAKALQARRATRYLESALRAYKYKVQMSDFGITKPAEKFTSALQSEVDAIVLTLAEKNRLENTNAEVVIFSTDRNQRLLAEKENIDCEDPFSYNIKAINKDKMQGGLILGAIIILCCPFTLPLVIFGWIGLDMYLKSNKRAATDSNKIKLWKSIYRDKRRRRKRKDDDNLPYDVVSPVTQFDDFIRHRLSADEEDDTLNWKVL